MRSILSHGSDSILVVIHYTRIKSEDQEQIHQLLRTYTNRETRWTDNNFHHFRTPSFAGCRNVQINGCRQGKLDDQSCRYIGGFHSNLFSSDVICDQSKEA